MANGIYNSNTPQIPGNGADLFGDKLVGNQFTDGTSQFTLGNFSIYSNAAPKDSRDFSLGNFSEPITLDTLQIEDITQAKLYVSNSLEVFINFDRSKVSNYALYGSLRERIKVAVQNVIKKFPAAILFNNVRTWSDYNTGDTAVNITYEPSDNQTFIDLNLYTIYNPFSIDYTKQAKDTLTSSDSIELRNLVLSFKKYALFYNDKEYPLQYLKPTSGNTTNGFLTIAVDGKPFGNSVTTIDSFYIKPTTTETEKAFDQLNDMEKFLVERKSTPKYTAKFQQPTETDSGKIIQATKSITWPTTDFWNIRINGFPFEKYLEDLYDIGDSFDSYKTNLISRFLTTAAFKEFDTIDEKVDKVLKIYGRSFDVIKKYIDGLVYMTNVTYDGVDNMPNTLLKNFARTLGWKTPSAIENKGFLDSIFSRNPDTLYEGQVTNPTPAELDTELYRRLLVNTAYLFKSKGTRKSIEFMLRFIGAPEALIEFNEHVYVAGAPINMKQFNERIAYISDGTYTEEVPVRDSYFTELSGTFPPITITGFTYGYETVVKETKVGRYAYPVDERGFPTKPRYGPDAYFQAGEGWFEETTEHRGKRVVDTATSVFTGNTPVLKTKLNKFTYGEPYLDLYRKFPDMNLGFPIVRTPDNKKSWVKKDTYNLRQYNLRDRGTYYYTNTDKLVLNVKNVELYLNVGQGLEWDVWNLSKRYGCPFGPTALSSPYPGIGGPDWTEIVVDASKLSFFEFAEKFWRVLINVKNRLTIDDGHGGGYPTLLNIYLNYLDSENVCGVPSNKYTYEKMIAYVENLGDYWIRLVEQFIPATTIWTGGIKYENSIFHRDKFVYKHEPLCDDTECFGSFVTCCEPIFNDILVEAANTCGGLLFSGATWQNKITLGGTEYMGDIYYSSTTIYDIPDTSDWLGDMTSILSGITQDVMDPNHLLSYYLINDITDPNIPNLTDPNCIIVQGPCGTGEEICDCPEGYTYDEVSESCVTYTASTVTTGETIVKADGVSSYGQFGARFCIPGTYTTCGSGATAANFNVIGTVANPFWDAAGTTTQGRLNQVGVNNATMTSTTQFFGFSRCVTAPADGEYLFGMAGDNQIRATLNGTQIVENPWDGTAGALQNFNYWWVWPVTLNAGSNTLLLEGANATAFGPASFGCEIVGPFPVGTFTVNTDFDIFATPAGVSAYTANTIFSSLDEVGGIFNTETNTCPSGYTYDLCTDSCIRTVPTECVTYPAGNDAWNSDNGVDPHYFTSEICLNVTNVQVTPVPLDTDIYAFYDTSSNPFDTALATRDSINTWATSLSGFTGNVYHIPLADERWLRWATIPISGGTFDTPTCCNWQNTLYGSQNNFSNLPSGTTYTGTSVGSCVGGTGVSGGFYTFPPNLSTNVLMFTFVVESSGAVVNAYHGSRGGTFDPGAQCEANDKTGSPPAWELAQGLPYNPMDDWNSPLINTTTAVIQPTPPYSEDFSAFTSAHASYTTFNSFMYPIVHQDQNETMMFPLHVYGAMFSGTVDPSQLIENPTVTTVGGTLTAITLHNPYTALTATNTMSGYVGSGLNNFGWGAKYDLGVSGCTTLCGDCTDPNCFSPDCPTNFSPNPCINQRCHRCNGTPNCVTNICNTCTAQARNVCTDTALFFEQQFQQDLAIFLEGNSTLSLVNCDICIRVCGNEEFTAPLWNINDTYEFGDIIVQNGNFYEWVSGESGTDGNPDNYNPDPEETPPSTTGPTPGGPPGPPAGPPCWPPPCGWQPVDIEPGGIPFLGGNNFTEGDNCDPYQEIVIPENPIPTGFTYTVDPVTFKDGIFNVGGQDCFESTYKICEEMVDPCACTGNNVWSRENAGIFYQEGDTVCCPENTLLAGHAFTMTNINNCGTTQFPLSLCDGGHSKCWVECVAEEIVVVTNDTEDACNPDSPSPGEDPVAVCECQETDYSGEGNSILQNVELDFYLISVNDVPAHIQGFKMNEDAGQTSPPNWWTTGTDDTFWAITNEAKSLEWSKAILNPCCLADEMVIYFDRYRQQNKLFIFEGRVKYELNITDSTQIEFYRWEYRDISDPTNNPAVRYFLHIPDVQTNTIIDTSDTSYAGFSTTLKTLFEETTTLSFQIQSMSSDRNKFYLEKLSNSTYLTDNGTGTNAIETTPVIRDRYFIIPPQGQFGVNGALVFQEMDWIVDTPNYNFISDDRVGSYNMQLQVVCGTHECTYLQFQNTGVDNSQIFTTVPVTNSCPTNLGAAARHQTGVIKSTVVDFAKGNVTGNRLEVDISKELLKNQTELNVNDYEIVDSQVYLIPTLDPFTSSAPQPYNSPTLVGTTTGPTSEVFKTEDGKEVTYLGGWLDTIETQRNRNTVVSFTTPSDLKQFGVSLRKKSIAGGTEKVGTSTRTYSNYEEWATRCVGLTNGVFNPKTINYNSDGEFEGFTLTTQLRRSATNSQNISGEAPIPTGNNSIILTTQGSWGDYLETQTGSTLSAFTSIVYSAYTNLSAYTDTSQTRVSSDQVHDICMVGDDINLNTRLFYSDRILSQPFKFINNPKGFIPFVPTNALWTNCGPYYVERTPTQYSYYQATKDICLRARLTTTINIQYQDPTWWNYLDRYKTYTKDKGNVPSNDYEYYSLLNSAIINGKSNILRPTRNTEGTFVNSRTKSNTYFPVDGLNADSGILDFQVRLTIQKSLSGVTSATTTLASYTVGANETDNSNADTFLTIPVNKTEENRNTYDYNSITTNLPDEILIEKNIIASLDTGTITLNEGERLFASAQIESLTTPKWTSTATTATTMTVRVGTNIVDSSNPEYPYFLITEESCQSALVNDIKLYWDSNDITKQITPLYTNGQLQPVDTNNEMGALYTTQTTTADISTDYRTEPITLSNLLSFSYVDLANKSETLIDNTTLVESSKKTNNWVKKIESGESSNLKINANKMITFNNMTVQLNLPVSKDTSTPMLSNPEYMYVLDTKVRVKGTSRVFPIISPILPTATQNTNKLNTIPLSTSILNSLGSSVTPSNIEDVNIDTVAGQLIINDEVINTESSYYNITKPSLTYGRKAYYKCGTDTFVEVPPQDDLGAQVWCCATETTPEYYPCGEKTQSQWIKMLGRDGSKYGNKVSQNDVRGVVLGTSKNNKTYGGGSQYS